MPDPQKNKRELLGDKLSSLLVSKGEVPVAFPSCAELYLCLVKKFELEENEKNLDEKDDIIITIFKDYFVKQKHTLFSSKEWKSKGFDKLFASEVRNLGSSSQDVLEPCVPSSGLTLNGVRRLQDDGKSRMATKSGIKRLFAADLIWLLYMENMGIFAIIDRILDDFALFGRYPIKNDELVAVVLEAMIRENRRGTVSTAQDRVYSYVQCFRMDISRKSICIRYFY